MDFFCRVCGHYSHRLAHCRGDGAIASRTGDAIGGLLNATFGNAPELIIATVALKAGLFDMVRASLIGAILANLLLALGVAFFLADCATTIRNTMPGPRGSTAR